MAGPIILPSGKPKWPPTWGAQPCGCCGGGEFCENTECVDADFSVTYERESTPDDGNCGSCPSWNAILTSNYHGNERLLNSSWGIPIGTPVNGGCQYILEDTALTSVCIGETNTACTKIKIPLQDGQCLRIANNIYIETTPENRRACYGTKVKTIGVSNGRPVSANADPSSCGDFCARTLFSTAVVTAVYRINDTVDLSRYCPTDWEPRTQFLTGSWAFPVIRSSPGTGCRTYSGQFTSGIKTYSIPANPNCTAGSPDRHYRVLASASITVSECCYLLFGSVALERLGVVFQFPPFQFSCQGPLQTFCERTSQPPGLPPNGVVGAQLTAYCSYFSVEFS
jgi:hypothetical protein